MTYFLFNKYIVSKVKWIDQNNVSLIYLCFDFNTLPQKKTKKKPEIGSTKFVDSELVVGSDDQDKGQ